jgi:hypothetical protein
MIKTMIKTGLTVMILGAAGSAMAQAPSGVSIRKLSFAGSGCPAGTISGKLASGFNAFTLFFSDFVAEVGPGIPVSQKRKNCMLSVDLSVPPGWSYSIAEVEYKGYVDLDRGVTAKQTSSYYFQGDLSTARLGTTMTGPKAATYRIKDILGIEAMVWSPCGATRALNINAQVLLNSSNRSAYGMISLDRIRGSVEQIYGLRWKRC